MMMTLRYIIQVAQTEDVIIHFFFVNLECLWSHVNGIYFSLKEKSKFGGFFYLSVDHDFCFNWIVILFGFTVHITTRVGNSILIPYEV
jgi:hypothetical protein